MSESRRTRWLAGLVVGAASGFVVLLAGPVGLLVALAFALSCVRAREALSPLAGLLTGVGSITLALIAVANARCTTVATTMSYSSCTAPDLSTWVAIAGVSVLAGVALSMAAIRRTQV